MLPLDELFGRIAVAKGDVPASTSQREAARTWYRFFLDQLTRQAQSESPGELSTHESVKAAVEAAYREYLRRQDQSATWRLLQDGD
jgi:hypothetical protein